MVLGSAISVFAKKQIHGLFRSLHGKRLGIFVWAFAILFAPASGWLVNLRKRKGPPAPLLAPALL